MGGREGSELGGGVHVFFIPVLSINLVCEHLMDCIIGDIVKIGVVLLFQRFIE